MLLDALVWQFPYYSTGWNSQRADYYVAFCKLASGIGAPLDYLGASINEGAYNANWIVNTLKPALNAAGLVNVKLQLPELNASNASTYNSFFSTLSGNPSLRNITVATSWHYLDGWKNNMGMGDIEDNSRAVPASAKSSGIALWNNEDFSWTGKYWDDALKLARSFNKYYIRDRVTHVAMWNIVDGIYQLLPWPNTGLMRTDMPWSGHYEVWPTVWACAHTTQFTEVGWKYLNSASGRFSSTTWKGSYVSLKAPDSDNYSIIICTNGPQNIRVNLGTGISTGVVHVWKSDNAAQFIAQPDITPTNGTYTVSLESNSIYSLTTTTGQSRGTYTIPVKQAFPFPYSEKYESYVFGESPRYHSDQRGSFAVDTAGGRKCLKQIMPQAGPLKYYYYPESPMTIFGDSSWSNYSITADVNVSGGYVEIGARVPASKGQASNVLKGYLMQLTKTGSWRLNWQSSVLASGTLSGFNGSAWHTLKLDCKGSTIKGFIDGALVGSVNNSSGATGMACFASSYNPNLFDNLIVSDGTTAVNTFNPINSKRFDIGIYSLDGRKLTGAENISANTLHLLECKLPQGIYAARIKTGSGITTVKFSIQH